MPISPSNISQLEDRVKSNSYGKYLKALIMQNVRSFKQQRIEFHFPVTAIIGTNGGGKSTILGAAALAFKSIKPGDFFPKSNIGDNSMMDWRIDYELIDQAIKPKTIIQKNARFVSAKWRRDNAAERVVTVIPIQRTVPAGEQTKFRHFIGLTKNLEVDSVSIPAEVSKHVGHIIGKDASNYKRVNLRGDTNKSILVGLKEGNDYSQFHFGAGEASIIEMVLKIENSSENSLILIEEIENGLHPIATRRMVEYLIEVARRKRCQIIFTTHSEYALESLPPSAIWACVDGTAYQGKLSIESLRAITGNISKDKIVFVEDDFAKDLVDCAIRHYDNELLHQIEIHKAGGYPHIISVLKYHQSNPSIKSRAVAIVDGDVNQASFPQNGIFCLPDGNPEQIVFSYIRENSVILASRIQQRCHCPTIEQDKLIRMIEETYFESTDPHLLYKILGEKMNFTSEIVIRRAFCSMYVEENNEEIAELVKMVKEFFTQVP